MVLNLRVIVVGMLVIFIAVFSLFFIVEWITRSRAKCETNINLAICKLGTVEIVIIVLLLIAGGMITIIGITSYVLLSGVREV